MNNKEQERRNTSKNVVETSDFLAFNDSQSFMEFSPANSSSPQKQWKQVNRNNYQKNWNHQNRRFSGNYKNYSYGNMEKPHNRTFHGPYDNYQRCSYNRSFGSNTSTPPKSNNYSPKHNNNRGIDIESYLHPSFMEDPWEALEKDRMNSESYYIGNEELKESSSNSVDEMSIET